MELSQPGMLFGFIALLIPVIIHLFNFRRHKTLYFSNIDLLKAVVQQSSKTNSIKHYLVLLSRLFMISFLVLAFTRPIIPDQNQAFVSENSLIALYIDNSRSMQAAGIESTLFEEAKGYAARILEQSPKESQFILIHNRFDPTDAYTMSRSEAQDAVYQLSSSGPHRSFSSIINRLQNNKSSNQTTQKYLFYFSDFQESSFNNAENVMDTTLHLYLVQTPPTALRNVYVDSCWLSSPVVQTGFPVVLKARIVNAGSDEIRSLAVNLYLGDVLKVIQNIDLPAGISKEVDLQILLSKPGFYTGKVAISDFPVVFDDELYFSFTIAPTLNILELTNDQPSEVLKNFFETDSLFNFEVMHTDRVDYQSLEKFQLIIVNNWLLPSALLQKALTKYVEEGGKLLLVPGKSLSGSAKTWLDGLGFSFSTFPDTVKTRVANLHEESSFWQDVFFKIPENADLPYVFRHYQFQFQQTSTVQPYLSLINSNPLLLGLALGKGNMYVISTVFDEDWTNLMQHPLFVPMMYKISFFSGKSEYLYETIGKSESYLVSGFDLNHDEPLRLLSSDSTFEMIPENRFVPKGIELVFHGGIENAGHYSILMNDQKIGQVSFNENRLESEMKFLNEKDIRKRIPDNTFKSLRFAVSQQNELPDVIKNSEKSMMLWKYCVILVLFFLLAEILIHRFWKELK